MKSLEYTFLGDGSSDKALMSIINWAIAYLNPNIPISGQHADLRLLQNPPKELHHKIEKAIELYPCEILFIHRDAEQKEDTILAERQSEISESFQKSVLKEKPKFVRIVPIRMMETWLLIDENAIKKAAGNRKYPAALDLPTIKSLESLPKAKEILYDKLTTASGLKGRNLQNSILV